MVTEYHDVLDDFDGTCTLREAVRSANNDVEADACTRVGTSTHDLIILPSGTFGLDLTEDISEDAALNGDLDVSDDVTIRGVARDMTIIDGDRATSQERIFEVRGDTLLILEDLTVTGGRESEDSGGNVFVSENGGIFETSNVLISNGRADIGGGVAGGGTMSFSDSEISGNETIGLGGAGGGIIFYGDMRFDLFDSVIVNNKAAVGGGIAVSSITPVNVNIIDSRIAGNEANKDGLVEPGVTAGSGGGIAVLEAAQLRMSRTHVADNGAAIGAGLYLAASATADITHSAITNNDASEQGGGVFATSDASVRFSTIASNAAATGGGVFVDSQKMFLIDSATIAANVGGGLHNENNAVVEFSLLAANSGGNCTGSAPAAGAYNLEDADSCGLTLNDPAMTNIVNTDPLLGPLQDNGGGLPTMALSIGSPAIDAYDAATRMPCARTPDQRTWARGYPLASATGTLTDRRCDIGAYEYTEPFLVDTTEDSVDADVLDGRCEDANGRCSLRAAIMQASEIPATNEIVLGAGTHTLSLTTEVGMDDGTAGDLDIKHYVIIRGSSTDSTLIDGNSIDRVFDMGPLKFVLGEPTLHYVSISDLSIRGGLADSGGAIRTRQPFQISHLTFENNNATNGTGGAIECTFSCRLEIQDSSFNMNSASGSGGAIFHNANDNLHINRSTFFQNVASIGGAIETTSTVHAINSTFSANEAGSSGALFANRAVLEHVTLADNVASGDTGAMYLLQPSAISNSVITNNTAMDVVDNCTINGDFPVTVGGNVTDTDLTDCQLDSPADLPDTDPRLEPLADNNGLTQTHSLRVGSPAIKAAVAERCQPVDQRGFFRDFDIATQTGCDAGAVELVSGDLSVSAIATPASVSVGDDTQVLIDVSNNGLVAATGIEVMVTLPSGLNIVSATMLTEPCEITGAQVICTLDVLEAFASVSSEIVARAAQAGTYTVTATANSATPDENTADNSTEVDIVAIAVTVPPPGGGGGGSTSLIFLMLLGLLRYSLWSPESLFRAFPMPIKGSIRSSGNGNTIVLVRSPATSFIVCK